MAEDQKQSQKEAAERRKAYYSANSQVEIDERVSGADPEGQPSQVDEEEVDSDVDEDGDEDSIDGDSQGSSWS